MHPMYFPVYRADKVIKLHHRNVTTTAVTHVHMLQMSHSYTPAKCYNEFQSN